jgi:prophage antirepressor-like protein
MTTEMKLLEFKISDIKTIKDIHGEIYYRARDITKILRYPSSKAAIKKHVPSDLDKEKRIDIITTKKFHIVNPDTIFINGNAARELVWASTIPDAYILIDRLNIHPHIPEYELLGY